MVKIDYSLNECKEIEEWMNLFFNTFEYFEFEKDYDVYDGDIIKFKCIQEDCILKGKIYRKSEKSVLMVESRDSEGNKYKETFEKFTGRFK